jgi:hypothetical protein
MRPDEQRHAEPSHSGAAHAVDGDDEVQSGKDGAEAGYEYGGRRCDDVGIQIMRRQRRGEGPPGIDAAQHHRRNHHCAADNVQVPAQQVDLGEGEVARAQHDGDEEVSQRRRNGRHEEQEDHDDAVHGEELVVGIGRD